MTRKDYIAISNLIRSTFDKKSSSDAVNFKIDETRNNFITALANHFEIDNPNFHRGKFIHACYWTKEDYKTQLELAGTKEVA